MAFNLADILNNVDVPKSDTGPELKHIPLERLRADEKNFYLVSEDSVADLAANIECVGLQQPLNVRPDPQWEEFYIVVSGHRRLAALRLLNSEGKAGFDTAPCMVVENGSEALNELRLIYGNANTRQLSNYELSKQAERVRELFYRLKEEGYEFPGRMRDHVAEACQISRSKLARLKVINEQLEVFLDLWQGGKLNESVAYELAQCPQELQWRIGAAKVKGDKLEAAKVKRVREAWDEGARWETVHVCTVTGKDCGHGDVALRRDLAAASWEGLCKAEKCCLKCEHGPDCRHSYDTCDRMCKVAADKAKAKREKDEADREKKRAEKKKWEDAMFQEILRPYVKAAEAAGLDNDVKLNMGYTAFAVAALKEACENPDKLQQQWLFRNPDGKNLKQIAEQLGCSIDFLLGRTEVMAVAGSVVDEADWIWSRPVWQADVPSWDGVYWCKVSIDGGPHTYVRLLWELDDLGQGGLWRLYTGQKIDDGIEVIGWWPLPEG